MKDFLYYVENVEVNTSGDIEKNNAHQKIQSILDKNNLETHYYGVIDGIAVNCFIQHSTNKILLVDPGLQEGETRDVYNLLSIFKQKYDDVMIVLSLDLWRNYDRVEKDLKSYFS